MSMLLFMPMFMSIFNLEAFVCGAARAGQAEGLVKQKSENVKT